jgi:signal transduction histidine kinase
VAFEAYEAAMARLRQRGDRIHQEHEAQLRRLEEHLQDREAMARAGELTAGIVHEVRNGLGTIVGYARMIERSGSSEEALAASRIREECETLESVVRRFMDFVRRETLAPAPVDLARMLSRVAAREGQRRPEVTMSLEVRGEDPFVADEELLERAFENLVRNACEAAGPGGRVAVSLSREGETRLVEIRDDGPGLPADVRSRLRPFFSTKAGGLGLGLAIALKIVQLHGGSLELGDAAPRGLAVRVWLPAIGPPRTVSPTGGGVGSAVTEGNAGTAHGA